MITLHLQIEERNGAVLPRFRCFADMAATECESDYAEGLSYAIENGIVGAKYKGKSVFPPLFISMARHLAMETAEVETAIKSKNRQRPMLKPKTVEV